MTAQLEAEHQLVQGKTEIEKSKVKLIELEQANLQAKELGNTKINAEAAIGRSRGEAEAIKIKKAAEAEKIGKVIEALQKDGDNTYIRLQQVLSFTNVDKTVIVPTDLRLFVPMGDVLQNKKIDEILEDEE